MATEADIPVPRGEQVGNFVDNIVKISVSEVPLEKQNQDANRNELHIVEGENFLKSPSIDEVHCEANNVVPDVSKVIEETPVEESQQNAEESNSKDGDRGVVSEKCSTDSSVVITPETKVGDAVDDPCTDNATGVTQQSNETSSDHYSTYDSSTKNVALTKEILLESSLPSEETESPTPCISQGEELNVQSKTTDDKSTDEKPTEEDMSSNLTNEMTSEREALENESSVGDNFNTAAEKASHENSTSEVPTLETSNDDELQSKSDLNTSLSEEESQHNAEESDSKDGDGDRGVVPEQCSTDSSVVTSEMKVGDTTDDLCTDEAKGVTQLSKETSSDLYGTNGSFTEKIELTKELLQESSLPGEETESHTPCISEGEELHVQSKTTEDKSTDEKPTEEDMSSDLTNKMTSEQVALENERSVEDNFNTAAEKASHENSTPGETITALETSNGDKLQSKSDLNSSLSKEKETAVQKGDKSMTTSEDYGLTSENTLSESHGDVECQFKTLEDAATDHGDSKLAEKSEESTLVQVEDSQIERDEYLEEESERLPLTEVSMAPAATDNVKDKDEDLKEAELSENEQRTSTSVKEDVHKENPAESFCVAPENIEVSDLSQENSSKGPPEEQSRNVTLHGDAIEAEEATIDAADGQKESLETCPPIVSSSHEEGSMAAVLKEDTSVHTDGKMIDEVDKHKEVLENLSSGEGHCEVNNVSPDVSTGTEKTDQTVKNGTDTLLLSPTLVDQPVELAANEETSAKEIQQNVEESNSTDKDGRRDVVPEVCSTDSSVVTSDIKVGDTLEDPDVDDAKVVTQLSKNTSGDHHGTNDSSTENVALTEEILQETDLPSEETESHTPGISEGEELNAQVKTTGKKSVDEKPTEEDISCNLTNEVSKEGESYQNKMTLEQEKLENERSVEDNFNTAAEKVSHENSTSGETIVTLETSNSDELQSKSYLNPSLSKEEETTVQKSDESVTTHEDYGYPSEKTLSESHGDIECQSKTSEEAAIDHSNPKLAEKSGERSLVLVEDSHLEHDEHFQEESKRLPLTESSTGSTDDNILAATDKVKDEDEDYKEAELLESEQSTKCTLVKEDVQIENPAESLHVALENIQVSTLSQENSIKAPPEEQSTIANLHGNTIEEEEATIDAADGQKDSHESFPPIVSGSPEEGSMNAVLEEVTSDHTDEKIIDEVDKHEEVIENLSTTVSTEEAEGNSLIKLEGSDFKKEDDSGKESEETPLLLPLAREVSDASRFLHEARFEDGEPNKAEFCDNERGTESMLLKTESRTENTEDVHVFEDTKVHDLVDKGSASGTVDAAEEKEETVENVPTIVPNEKMEKNSFIQVDGQEMENEEHLDKENEQLSSRKDYTVDANNDEVIEKNTSSAGIETTCSLEEQSLAENIQTIISNEITDAADKKELTLENVATETPHQHTEENSVTQVDCSVKKHEECSEEDNQNSSLTEASIEETDARESKNIDEPKNRGEESITPELENEENTESTYVKEETDVEKSIDSLQVEPEDINQHNSSADINKSIEEENSNTDPREISTDKAERDSVDAAHINEESVETKDVTKDIPDCDKEDSIPIEEVGSQNPLNEASAGNGNDEESTKITEGCLITNEEPLESLQVAAQDIEAPPLSRDRETSSLDEENSTTNPEAIMDDNKEEIADNATGEEDETPKDKDIGKDISDCGKEDNIPIEEVGSQKPLNEASAGNANNEESTKITEGSLIEEEASLESLQEAAQEIETPPLSQEREISSLDEQSPIANPEGSWEIADNEIGLEGETPKDKNIANTTPYEDKEENLQVQEDCSRLEQNESENIPSSEAPAVSSTESSPVKEEEKVEMPTEEQILAADPQETCDETQEKTVDAAKENNDVVISVPTGDSEDNSPIEVDGLQEPSFEEVPTEKINDDEPTITHEAKFKSENTVKPNLYGDEEKIECALVKEEVHIESLQVADEDIKNTSSGQDREASHLEEQAPTTDSHGTMGDEKDAKTLDSTDLKEETLKDKNYATTPDEDTKEDSLNQVDGLLLEQEEDLEKDSERTSLTDAQKDDITESTLVREVAHVEDPIDSSQVATEDIEAFAPCQDTERSSTVEQILDPEDISSKKIAEKIVDATGEETQEAQDVAKSVPHEDDSPNEQNTEATLIKEDVSIELPQIAVEDREEPSLSEVRETNSQEEQILCASPGVHINDNEENKTMDPTVYENETPKDEVPKEMESVGVKGAIKEEEGYLKAVQMTTAVIVASNQERSLNLTAEENPCAEDLNFNKDIIGNIPEVSNYKQQDSPVMKVSEEHMMTSNEHVVDSTSMESEVSEKNNNQVVGEENSCGDKTDLDKREVLNDAPAAVPTSETLAETDSRGCTETEVQVPNGEKEAEIIKREAENDQKNIKETLPNYAASEDVSESKEVNGEEEIDSNNCKEISSSPISVASEEVSTSNVASEEDSTSNSVTDLETKNEEEAPAIKETTPSSVEGRDAESVSVEENSNYVGSLPEEKSDSNEVAFTPGENKSGYESNNRGLESVAQVQSFDIISKTEEEDLKAEAEIQSDKAVTEDILQEETKCEKETMKDDISSEKEQLPRIKEEHEDIKDYHQGSCEEEVTTDSHQEDEIKQDQHINSKETYEFTKNGNEIEMVLKVSEEADDKAPEDLEEKIFTNEAIHRILHQEEQATSNEEPTTKIDNEKARELDIACVKTDAQDSNKEGVQIAIIPGRESEEQNKEDEICSAYEVQVKDEENLMLSEGKSEEEAKETYKEAYVEAEKLDLSSQTKDISECAISDVGQETPEDNEKSMTEKKFSEEDYPEKSIECEASSASEDIALRGQSSEDTIITAEVQEAKAGIDLGAAVPEATGLESQKAEEFIDKCTEMADISTPVKTSVISTPKNIGESIEGTPLQAEDQQTKLHELPEESNMRDTEVKTSEKDDAVNLQSLGDISEDVQNQELCKESMGVSNNHNPVEGDPGEKIETSEGQETKPIQSAPVSESLKQETEEQQLGRDTVDVHEEEKNLYNIPNQLESFYSADTEKVPESKIHQSSVEDKARHDKKEGNQQIDSPLCSDIKTSENKPVHVGGLGSTDVTEPEASSLSLKDKHVVLEADDTRNLNPENLDGDKNISSEHSQGEHEVVKPSKGEQEEEEYRNEERTDQEMEGKSESEETGKPSLSDLLQVSTRGTSEMADHSPTEKEPTSHAEDMRAENIDAAEHENSKTDEEKDDEEESHEQIKSDLGSEAPVMVDIGDADVKVAHKKSHNILSGVGSKVKHSIAKVKKAITGKSPSPKKVINPESK